MALLHVRMVPLGILLLWLRLRKLLANASKRTCNERSKSFDDVHLINCFSDSGDRQNRSNQRKTHLNDLARFCEQKCDPAAQELSTGSDADETCEEMLE
jgi:hypothetical protein